MIYSGPPSFCELELPVEHRLTYRDKQGSPGFTLIELLTVIAIVGVLATLLLTALSSGLKMSKQAQCTSDLHQISLAMNMYLEDFRHRLLQIQQLTSTKYLPGPGVLVCPSDSTGNWGGLVNAASFGGKSEAAIAGPAPGSDNGISDFESVEGPRVDLLPYSYLHPLPWEDWAWQQLIRQGTQSGLAVCQLHGLGRPNRESPSVRDFEGLILRAQLDGVVVRRKVFWPPASPARSFFDTPATETTFLLPDTYPWSLFTDVPNASN